MNKKAKRYDEGGDVETETAQGQNSSIGDDVRARAMAAMANQSSTSAPTPTKKAVGKAIAKAATTEKSEATAPAKKNPVQQAKDVVSGSGMFSKLRSPGAALSSYEQAGPKRSEQAAPAKRAAPKISTDSSDAYKKGGKVSSASKRADGIASKGKTKGKWC